MSNSSYGSREAAKFLGIRQASVLSQARRGRIGHTKNDGGIVYFSLEELEVYKERQRRNRYWLSLPRDERPAAFDAKYGEGCYDELLGMFRDPDVRYARIADKFGVCDESVNFWRNKLFPKQKNKGRDRQVRATLGIRREELLKYPLVRSFYDNCLRGPFSEDDIMFIRGYENYLMKRHVRLHGKDVFLRKAVMRNNTANGTSYQLTKSKTGKPDFYYFSLGEKDFLFLRPDSFPLQTAFTDDPGSKYYRFRNNFDVLFSNAD